MKKLADITSTIFGWGVYICLFAGGFAAFGYVIALIIGGGAEGTGYELARFIQRQYFPFVVRIVSASVLIGLASMYFAGEKALSLTSDMEAAKKAVATMRSQIEADEAKRQGN